MTEEIRKTIVVDAPPAAVFKALTDEKELVQWFPNQGAMLEARVGGAVEFKFLRPDGEKHTMHGRILEIIPGKKLSYSWKFGPAPDSNEVVTWTLEPADGGKTRVTLLHTGFKKPSQKDIESGMSLEAGWSHFVSQLANHCKGKLK
jgi:uncharacterized protein YndB with AHSA1/START domain